MAPKAFHDNWRVWETHPDFNGMLLRGSSARWLPLRVRDRPSNQGGRRATVTHKAWDSRSVVEPQCFGHVYLLKHMRENVGDSAQYRRHM